MRGIEPGATDRGGADHGNSGMPEGVTQMAWTMATERPPPNHHLEELLAALGEVGAAGLGGGPGHGADPRP